MYVLERITNDSALNFKAVRLRALLDSPTAFGGTYAKESLLSDAEWIVRAGVWSSGRSIGYLARDSGTLRGIVSGFLEEDDPTVAHLVSMWVDPECRRRGLGRQLIDAVVDWAQQKYANTLRLMVTSSNQAAIEFYKRNEFLTTGRTKPYPNNPALIEYEMTRSIVIDTRRMQKELH